jgi:hypothetical protein
MSATGYTRELERIKATQKAWEYKKHGRPMRKAEPFSFKDWYMQGIEHYKKQGFVFEQVDRYTLKIIPPGKPAFLRTGADFKDEYENEYLSKF